MDIGEAAEFIANAAKTALNVTSSGYLCDDSKLREAVEAFRKAAHKIEDLDQRTTGQIRYGSVP